MRRIAVMTSGGDSPGMNAAIRAVVRFGIERGLEVYGIERGFQGLLDGDMHKMDRRSVGDILQRGGTILKTARCKEYQTIEGTARAHQILETFGIEALVNIGGEGSMQGTLRLSRNHNYPVICIPGTIDNDLAYTEMTIGFDTAVNTVLDAITRVRDTSSAHDRTTLIEVMGRHCGDIALYSGLAGGAEFVLVPEREENLKDLCQKIIEGKNSGKQHSIIIRAEGYPVSSQDVVEYVRNRTGQEVRLVVLSYLQRGGSPSLRDRIFATECGLKAVELLCDGIYNKAIGLVGGEVVGFDLAEALDVQPEFKADMYEAIKILAK
ncbi:MAG: 6-phosphofructokinase [Mogibacterium sp.]|nr:6-phosphofructokinase [Mogibacterium sp.]